MILDRLDAVAHQKTIRGNGRLVECNGHISMARKK